MSTSVSGLSSLLGGFRRSVRSVRRGGAAVLALVLCVSVLVTVTGSPAGAANTVVESLVDADNNATTPPVRALAGSNRYATSLAVAGAFVSNAGVGGFADSVIIASGESLIDAAAAAGLAAAKSAPVLLTPPGRLPRAVANFIVDEFISDVFIVGGTSAVSERVEEALNELTPVRSVTRLAGEDRYATAVAVSEEVGDAGLYCDSAQRAALVVNVDNSFADVISVGPLAYATGLPMLLTGADELPVDVVAYLIDAEIERVVVVGGTSAVSEEAVAEMITAGVSDVERIAGANRFETAVAILNALKACVTIAVSPGSVAFVNASAAADGVSAAPLLGLGLDGDGVTPMLLVTASGGLPAATRAYLSAVPTRTIAGYIDVSLTAIGGTSVIPVAVMNAAIAAATTSEPITATITAKAEATTATVLFSAPVDKTKAETISNYRVAGAPLLSGDTVTLKGDGRTATITLTTVGNSQFAAGTTIEVAGKGKITGSTGDLRKFGGARYTVPNLSKPEKIRPRVRISAPENGYEIRITQIEENVKLPATVAAQIDLSKIKINNAPLPATSATPPVRISTIKGVGTAVVTAASAQSFVVCLFGGGASTTASGITTTADCTATPPTGEALLAKGDRITVEAEAFTDKSGNISRTASVAVVASRPKPLAVRAAVTARATYDTNGAATPGGEKVASWTWGTYDKSASDVFNVVDNYLTITAKPSGVATGALGNGWFIDWYQLETDEDDVSEVKVNVYDGRKIIRVGFDDDAKLYDAVTALREDAAVTADFVVTSDVLVSSAIANKDLPDLVQGSTLANNLLFTDATIMNEPANEGDAATAVERRRPTLERHSFGVQAGTNSITGETSVFVTITYNDILKNFVYTDGVDSDDDAGRVDLIDANAGADDYPAEANWQSEITSTLASEFTFQLRSTKYDGLPAVGGTIRLPAGVATNYKTGGTSVLVEEHRLRSS